MYGVVSLTAATSTDHLNALAEVRDFAQTDMGRGHPHRYTYRILSEPTLSNELRRLSSPYVRGRVAGVSMQPCPLEEFQSQDRHFTESWPTPSGSWTFNAVLDGRYLLGFGVRALKLPLRACRAYDGGLCLAFPTHHGTALVRIAPTCPTGSLRTR